MPDFVYDNVTIPTKLQRRALPAGEDPLKWDQHTDYNAHTDMGVSLRSGLLTGQWHGFSPRSAGEITALSQASAYRVAVRDSDKHLVYWNGTTLTDLSAGGGGGVSVPLELTSDDASNSSVVDVLKLRHTTSGSAATGIGVGLLWESEDGGGNLTTVVDMEAVLSTVSDGDETGYLRCQVMTGGALADAFYAHGGGISVGVPSISALYPMHVAHADGDSAGLFETTDTANGTVINALRVHRATSHASHGATGIGVGILFESEDASGNAHQAVADIAGVLSVATHTSEKGYLRFRAMNGAAAMADSFYAWGTGRVGIGTGTTEPSSSLHVISPAATAAATFVGILDKTATAGQAFNMLADFRLNGTQKGALFFDASDILSLAGSTYLSLVAGGTVAISLSSTVAYINGDIDHNGTNVGFYSTTPVARNGTPFTLNSGALAHDLPASPTAQQVGDCLRQLLTYLGDVSGNGLMNVTA